MSCCLLRLISEVSHVTFSQATGCARLAWEEVDRAEAYSLLTDPATELFVLSHSSASYVDGEVPVAPVAATSALEEMALYSNKRKLRQGRRSLEAPVPT